jgi:hypothetical protein
VAEIRTSFETARGCGYRKPGGLYLVCDGRGLRDCGRLPHPVGTCPCCGYGIKPARGWTWIDPRAWLPECSQPKTAACKLCLLHDLPERVGLLWVGERFYATPEEWLEEAADRGASRRVHAIPKGFEVGKTLVLMGHRKGALAYTPTAAPGLFPALQQQVRRPAIFAAWRPQRVEYVVTGLESPEKLEQLAARGIELVDVVRADQQV